MILYDLIVSFDNDDVKAFGILFLTILTEK